ncbi:MAG: hypothetical protein HY966_02660 [Ignavibacteriales bacterium]|nr:hypothetical protein [Ignavibacteriales bacterium]
MKKISAVRRKVLIALLLAPSMFLAWQCIESPESFIAPSSDIKLSIPLADIKRTVYDMFTKDTSRVKVSAADNSYYFDDIQAGVPSGIDTLKAQASPTSNQVTLGRFSVPGLASTNQQVTLTQLGLTAITVPSGVPFPGSSVTLPSTTIDQSTQFDFVQIFSGTLTLSITNNLPLQVNFTQPLVLKNNKTTAPVDTSVIASFNIGLVDSLKSKTVQVDLAGKFLRGALRTGALGFSTVTRTGPFTIQSTAGLSFGFSTTSLVADSASAVIPSQPVASFTDSSITVDDSVNVVSGTFKGGLFQAKVTNNLGINVGVRLKFSNFVSTAVKDTFTVDRAISPKTALIVPVRMDTIQIINGTSASKGTTMRFSASIYTINSGTAKASVTLNDFVKAEFLPQQPFVIKSVTGKIKPTPLVIASGASGANLGDASSRFQGQFTFDSVRIAVDLGMTGGYPVKYNMRLVAVNRKTGAKDSLTLPAPLGQGADTTLYPNVGNFAFTRIQLGNSQGLNQFLSKFVPNFPDTFYIRGSAMINPAFGSSTIYDSTKLYTRVNVYFPLKIGIVNGSARDSISLPKGNFQDLAKSVKSGKINLELENGIPLQLVFRAQLRGKLTPSSSYRTLLTLPTTGDSLFILPAQVDANGNTTSPRYSSFAFQLSDFMRKRDSTLKLNDAELFNLADSLYFQIGIITSSDNNAKTVKLRQTDYLRTRMSASLIYTVNKP